MVLVFVRVVIGATFGMSAVLKLRAPTEFIDVLPRFGIDPAHSRPVAWTVIISEAAVAIAMAIGGPTLMAGLLLAVVLLVGFSVALTAVLARRVTTSCHCFGRGETPVSWVDLCRNAGLLALAGAGLPVAAGLPLLAGRSPNPWPAAPSTGLSLVTAVAGLLFAVIWSRLSDLADLLRTDAATGDGRS